MTYTILAVFAVFLLLSLLSGIFIPKEKRYIALLSASLLCVLFLSRVGIIFLLLNIVITFFSANLMEKTSLGYDLTAMEKKERKAAKAEIKLKKKRILIVSLFLNLSMLFILKYLNMFTGKELVTFKGNFLIPLGLSYYTLQSAGYLIDVYRGKYKAEQSFLKTALFIAYFPQLHEGPFGRYDLLKDSLYSGNSISEKHGFSGSMLCLWGLFKIFMIANRASIISDSIFSSYEEYGGFTILLGGIAFVLQLYAEFSGYIDIARGVSEILGISLSRNFHLPFLAENIADFWRRWHISLGTWFRDYVFYPVSTSKWLKNATSRMKVSAGDFTTVTVSLFIVWLLTGLWHGASYKYALYGLYYFVLMVLHNILSGPANSLLAVLHIDSNNKVLKVIQIIKTQFFVIIGMILFRAENTAVFFHMIRSIFVAGNTYRITEIMDVKDLTVLILSVLVLLLSSLPSITGKDPTVKLEKMCTWQKYGICFFTGCIIVIFGAYGLDYIPPDPIYGGF